MGDERFLGVKQGIRPFQLHIRIPGGKQFYSFRARIQIHNPQGFFSQRTAHGQAYKNQQQTNPTFHVLPP